MQQDLANTPKRTREEEIALKNKRTGLTIFQVSWIMAFVSLIVANWQLRFQYATWPPQGVEPMNPLLPTLATVGLLASVYFAYNAHQAIKANETGRFLFLWRITLGLGVAFIAVMVFEFFTVTPDAMATQYGVLFRVMTGFHGVHALTIGFIMFQVYRHGQAGAYHADEHWAVEGASKLWYFVVIAWILFYIVLYWV